jgi:polyisoprenoid-binding protein YceI
MANKSNRRANRPCFSEIAKSNLAAIGLLPYQFRCRFGPKRGPYALGTRHLLVAKAHPSQEYPLMNIKTYLSEVIAAVAVTFALTAAFAAGKTAAAPAASVSAKATTIPVQSDHGKLEFHAVGRPSMIKVNGEGKGPQGALMVAGNKVSGDLTFDLATLSSGISMRDEHMKEKYLEVGKFPSAKLHLTEVNLPAAWSMKSPVIKDAVFKGDLTLHGVTKPIEGKFEITGAPSAFSAKADFEVKMDEYGIEIPKYLGITVKNDVPVSLSMTDLKAN